ncbi:MAG: DUF885 family protein [Bacilli bacterium]
MKKKKLGLLFLLPGMVFTVCNSVGCSDPQPDVDNTDDSNDINVIKASIVMNDLTVDYDGEVHSITVQNLPEGATVTYTNNDKVNPGAYTVEAHITLADGTVFTKSATLFIKKNASVLTADPVQVATTYGGAIPAYTLNNDSQEVVVTPIYRAGKYQVELYAEANAFYKESNHVIVDFTVVDGNPLGVSFKSEKFTYDGTAKTLEASGVPDGYTVEYVNNTGTNKGKYNAVCKVYDSGHNLALSLNAILEIDVSPNAAFETFLDTFFVDYLGTDYLAWNIFTINPENFDLIRDVTDEATWYTYESITEQDLLDAYNEMSDYRTQLTTFSTDTLSDDQLISYDRLLEFFDSYVEYYDPANGYSPLMLVNYIDQFGGYPADFGTYAEAYEFRTEQDIKDLLSYIKSLPSAFASYVTYGQDRITAGYPLSDYTISEMTSYLTDVINAGSEYYLGEVIKNKVNACDYLSDTQKETYCSTVDTYMSTYFIPAHESLKTSLQDLRGNCTVEGYLASYGEAGKKLYEYELRDLLGLKDFNISEFGEYLVEKIDLYSGQMNNVIGKAQSNSSVWKQFMSYYNGYTSIVGITDPVEMIDYLKEFATTIVPTLSTDPEISIKYMDEAAAKKSNAVAYYMKSALDSDNSEHITLNGEKLRDDYNETLSTMAHEGYPGHLYAYLFDKQLNISNAAKIMTSTAHGEGWATYVQLKLFEYIKNTTVATSTIQKDAIEYFCDYNYYSNLTAYLAYTYVDYGIHILGWTADDINAFLGGIGFSSSAGDSIYHTLIETPTTYAAYGFGMSYYVDLHDNAKEKLGDLYDEIEFNSAILSHGWCSLGELKEVTDEYIEDTLFVLGALRVSK